MKHDCEKGHQHMLCTGSRTTEKKSSICARKPLCIKSNNNIQSQRLVSQSRVFQNSLVRPQVPSSFAHMFGGMRLQHWRETESKSLLLRLIGTSGTQEDLYWSSSGASLYALHHRWHFLCGIGYEYAFRYLDMIGPPTGGKFRDGHVENC